jgi:PBSX family phage terminase large subunit
MPPKTVVIKDEVNWNQTQALALRYLLRETDVRAIYCFGGVRSGKSFLICKAAQAIATMFPKSKILIARDTRVNLRNTTMATFFGQDFHGKPVIIPQLYRPENYNKTEGILTWNNGSTTSFWGMETPEDVERVKSTQWSAIFLEEAPAIDIEVITFLLETRLSDPVGPHKMLLTSNTDTGHSDLFSLFHDTHTCDPQGHCETCGRACEFRRIASNTLENQQNLPEDYIRRIKRLEFTNPRYYRVYVMGEFMEFTKKIFPEFDPNVHVIDLPPGWQPPPGTVTAYGYDHGYSGAPSCLLSAHILPDGSFLFFDEYYETGKSVKQMSQDFKEEEIFFIHAADPSIRNKTQYKEDREGGGELCSVQDLYTSYGVSMDLANNEVSGGIEKIKSLLIDDPTHQHPIFPDINHAPYFFIARIGGKNTCPNLTRQIQKYRNKVDARGNVDQKKWSPVKEDDHAVDPARYIVNSPITAGYGKTPEPTYGTVQWVRHKLTEAKRKEESREEELSLAV